MIAPGKKNRPGIKIVPTHITIHNTDNTDAGADAAAHSGFVRNTGYYVLKSGKKNWVSWHFTVDDKAAIRHLPSNELGYHAGPGNAVSVAIEICMNKGIDRAAADSRAALLTATLMGQLGIPASKVVPHKQWTGKICPSILLGGKPAGARWSAFIAEVRQFAAQLGNAGAGMSPMAAAAPSMKSLVESPDIPMSLEHLEFEINHRQVRLGLSGGKTKAPSKTGKKPKASKAKARKKTASE